ncbi:MAG: hypothetical protein AUH72_13595 [Acidobacteria bacterium 13_1_40CM_4_65_8]|nr:MAG: hypothetical protein AUH72_13595 [Acidobacteria bacterium 13_1_40CM_4_65_8]
MFNLRARRLLAFGVLVAIACITPSRVRAAAQDPGVTWLIFVDDLHLDFRNTGYIRKLLRSIASELIRDGDAFVLRSSGPSPSIPFTTNRSLLDAAIGRVTGNGLQPAAILWLSPANEIQDELRYRASLAGSAATEMLNAGPSLASRRQAMLYVTNGYPLDPPDARVAGFASAAQRANVTVFAMNARGLPSAPASPVQGDAALWASYRAAMLNSLRAISEPTGGFAVLDEADFADALQRIGRRMR